MTMQSLGLHNIASFIILVGGKCVCGISENYSLVQMQTNDEIS